MRESTSCLDRPRASCCHVCRRRHYEIADLTVVVNRSDGTGIELSPGAHPASAHGTLFPAQAVTVRDVLADCAGLVRWGGDSPAPAEGRFWIDVPPDDPRVASAAAEFVRRRATPGRGPGAIEDPLRRGQRRG